ncbi:MAG: efflux RND transporter permease subunit, partial [Bacteroidales bacterium]|nr:efflux RND transporter permease subunit [Bacteroidales bacterium]
HRPWIRLGEIATVKEYWSPPNIERKRKERIVTVSVTPYKRALNLIVADIQKELDALTIPSGVMVEISGAFEDMSELVYISAATVISLMAGLPPVIPQFESLEDAFGHHHAPPDTIRFQVWAIALF